MRSIFLKDELMTTKRIKAEDLEQIVEMKTYNSVGTIQLIIELLKIVLNRIEIDKDEIVDGRNETLFTSESFRTFISDNFSSYITDELYEELKTERINKIR